MSEHTHAWTEEYYGWLCVPCGLFYAYGCAPWEDDDWSEVWDDDGIRAKAGLPATVKFHHLRHTASTRVMELGTPDEIRDRIFGWGNKSNIRSRYSHATLKAMRRTLEDYELEMWKQAA